ncbi:MAG: NADAR family protein [Bacteroidales bacterium]|nr:NADAR family protein [Bacteroidales bacterium]
MSRESKIQYNPALSVKENAKRNGVSDAAIRYYIKVNGIDRRFDRKQNVIDDCRKYLKKHPKATWKEISEKTGHTEKTIRQYREYITTEKELVDFDNEKAKKRQEREAEAKQKVYDFLNGIPKEEILEYLAKREEQEQSKIVQKKTRTKVAEISNKGTAPNKQVETNGDIVEIRYRERKNPRSNKYYGLVRCTKDYAYFYQGVPFSNWWNSPAIEYDGHTFSSSESLFMYLKAKQFGDTETAEKIAKSKYNQAKELGKEVKNFNYSVWCRVREDAMYTALEQKLKCDAEFKEALLSDTYKGKTWVEASRKDDIWGIGAEASDAVLKKGVTAWKGTNLLGKTLTRLRDNTIGKETI